MHRVTLRIAIAGAALIIATMPSVVFAALSTPQVQEPVLNASSNDYRCFYGPGIQVWQDINKGGPTMILCGNLGYWSNLSNKGESLSGGTWNDRISSFESFNSSVDRGGSTWKLCTDAGGLGTCNYYYGSVYVSNVGSTLNDRISSIRDVITT